MTSVGEEIIMDFKTHHAYYAMIKNSVKFEKT